MVFVPWRFYEDLSTFNREMNHLFDRFFGRELIDGSGETFSCPPFWIAEKEDVILVNIEAHGFSSDELEVTFIDDLLIIKGTKKTTGGIPHYRARELESFKRTLRVLKKIKADSISAKLKNGNLTIILPKVKEITSSFKITID